jgi:lipase
VSLRIRTYGDGPRPVLALHCALAHGGAWAGLNLPGVTLTAPDLPGHGGSPDWKGTDYHTDCTRAVLGLMDAPMDIVGHSSGAAIALRMALERPDLVRTLTLIEPVLFAAARAADAPAFKDHLVQHAVVVRALRDNDWQAAAVAFHTTWGTGPFTAQSAAVQAYMAARMPLIAALDPALSDDTGGLLSPYRLESLGVPVLLLEGAQSPPVIAAIHDELQRRLPQVTRRVIPRAAHMLPLTHTAQVSAAIAAHQG